jgi:hypothetical protein
MNTFIQNSEYPPPDFDFNENTRILSLRKSIEIFKNQVQSIIPIIVNEPDILNDVSNSLVDQEDTTKSNLLITSLQHSKTKIKAFKTRRSDHDFSYFSLRHLYSIKLSISIQEKLINYCFKSSKFFDKFYLFFYSQTKIKFQILTDSTFDEIVTIAFNKTVEALKNGDERVDTNCISLVRCIARVCSLAMQKVIGKWTDIKDDLSKTGAQIIAFKSIIFKGLGLTESMLERF